MKLLLDEMLAAVIAEQLRHRGHDVTAVQEQPALRGLDDASVLAAATAEQRAVVTDNVGDFLGCHGRRVAAGQVHHGLLLLSNTGFSRHRHDLFVGHVVTALTAELAARPKDDPSSWIAWLTSP